MKRLIVIVLLASTLALPAISAAQSQSAGNVIPLNDSSPAMDIVVNSQPGAAGALVMQLSGASVTVSDASGQSVFEMADRRAHELQLRFGAGSSSHTVTVERLPGVQEAYFSATPVDDLLAIGSIASSEQGSLQVGQGLDSAVSATTDVPFAIPDGQIGRLMTSFSGYPLSAKIVDSVGIEVARLNPSMIDGLSITLDGGQYALGLINTDAATQAQTSTSVTAASLPSLPDPVEAAAQATQAEAAAPATAPTCLIQLTSSAEVHSGPGFNYSLMGYAPRGITLLVGGVNRQGDWTLIGDGTTSGWVNGAPGIVSGDCSQVATYDIPPANTNAAPNLSANPQQPSGERESGEHESGEHESGEHESGDD